MGRVLGTEAGDDVDAAPAVAGTSKAVGTAANDEVGACMTVAGAVAGLFENGHTVAPLSVAGPLSPPEIDDVLREPSVQRKSDGTNGPGEVSNLPLPAMPGPVSEPEEPDAPTRTCIAPSADRADNSVRSSQQCWYDVSPDETDLEVEGPGRRAGKTRSAKLSNLASKKPRYQVRRVAWRPARKRLRRPDGIPYK